MTDSSSRSLGSKLPSERPVESSVEGGGPVGRRIGELLFAAGTIALGSYALLGAGAIRVPGSVNTLGPQAFPYLVGAMLTLSGLVVAVQAFRGRLGDPEAGEDIDPNSPTDWLTVVKLVGFFVAHTLLISIAGWPIAAALLFAGAAWSLGARRWWQAALAGLALGLLVQLVFGTWLGLSLPPGPLLDWVPFF